MELADVFCVISILFPNTVRENDWLFQLFLVTATACGLHCRHQR